LLGAANLGDIGRNFPDTDDQFKDIDSRILLNRTHELIIKKGYMLGNIDSTLALQKPKIMNFIPEMQRMIADVLEASVEDISIKATTTEKLGFEGREEGVSAYATVLIYKF
jgi:2-C-methyl-D-erythritol 2,4-cyclodiphosphate synthase